MPLFVKVRSFLRNLFSCRRVDLDLNEEVHSHLELLIEENIRAGMLPQQAQRAAATHRQVDTGEDRASEADASVAGGSREMVEACGSRLLQLSRRTRQSRQSPEFSVRSSQTLAAGDSPSQSAERDDVGAPGPICG